MTSLTTVTAPTVTASITPGDIRQQRELAIKSKVEQIKNEVPKAALIFAKNIYADMDTVFKSVSSGEGEGYTEREFSKIYYADSSCNEFKEAAKGITVLVPLLATAEVKSNSSKLTSIFSGKKEREKKPRDSTEKNEAVTAPKEEQGSPLPGDTVVEICKATVKQLTDELFNATKVANPDLDLTIKHIEEKSIRNHKHGVSVEFFFKTLASQGPVKPEPKETKTSTEVFSKTPASQEPVKPEPKETKTSTSSTPVGSSTSGSKNTYSVTRRDAAFTTGGAVATVALAALVYGISQLSMSDAPTGFSLFR